MPERKTNPIPYTFHNHSTLASVNSPALQHLNSAGIGPDNAVYELDTLPTLKLERKHGYYYGRIESIGE